MNVREKEVLNMQLTMIPVLTNAWEISYDDLSKLFQKAQLVPTCVELKLQRVQVLLNI